MHVIVADWADGLDPAGPQWADMACWLRAHAVDLLITNELPFGAWLPTRPRVDADRLRDLLCLHEIGVAELCRLGLPTIISSRPVCDAGRVYNEAILIRNGRVQALHRKRHLPDEPGWHEQGWFTPGKADPRPVQVGGAGVGTLLCTEAIFTEDARRLGLAGVDILAIPRATAAAAIWPAACAMAACSAGAFVLSANRSGGQFAGGPLAFDPAGRAVALSRQARGLYGAMLDLDQARRQKRRYPCYLFRAAD
jgi:N-carbamoylputrescine amidase